MQLFNIGPPHFGMLATVTDFIRFVELFEKQEEFALADTYMLWAV